LVFDDVGLAEFSRVHFLAWFSSRGMVPSCYQSFVGIRALLTPDLC